MMRRPAPNAAVIAAAASVTLPSRITTSSATAGTATTTTAAATATSSKTTINPVSNGRRRSRQRQRQQKLADCCRRAVQILIGVVLLFTFLDLFELVIITKHHKLSELPPVLRQQKEAVVNVWQHEKEVLKKELDHLIHHRQRRNPPTLEPEDHESYDPNMDVGKEKIYEILEQAGVKKHDMDLATRRKLPTWTKVQQLYGTEPKIYGLERCKAFTSNVDPAVSFFGIAGTFNSGTNLLAELLIQNCQITQRMQKYGEDQKGIRWQVPWGKHTPVEFREQHVTTTDRDVPLENSFPMITIRDPYRWMQSMCKHTYGAEWNHNKSTCPNVYDEDYKIPNRVRVKYKSSIVWHKSLPAMWNDWYNHYFEQSFPRVFVRFEDLLFYGKNVTETLCLCGGGVPRRDYFVHVKSSAKLGTAEHGANKTGLLDALIQYGTDDGRLIGLTPKDLEWSYKLLDPKLMYMFNYPYAMNF